MSEYETRKALIENLFDFYGKELSPKRVALYLAALEDIPTDVLRQSIKKVVMEKEFFPSVASIIEAGKSLIASVDESKKVKTWEQAWGEIFKGMYKAKEPEWSTPEIAAAVHAFGWVALININACDLTTTSAQIRRYYEDACRRTKETMINDYLLEKAGVKTLCGLQEGTPKLLKH